MHDVEKEQHTEQERHQHKDWCRQAKSQCTIADFISGRRTQGFSPISYLYCALVDVVGLS